MRRTLTITIHESWTFVWTPEQTNDSQVVAEDTTLLSPAALVQQLGQWLGLSAGEPAVEPTHSVQIFVQYQPKK